MTFKLEIKTADDMAREALEIVKAHGHANLIAWVDAVSEGLTGRTPEYERLSWTAKAEAARAWLGDTLDGELVRGGTEAQRAMLQAEATMMGRDVDDIAARILAKASQFAIASATLSGLRQTAAAAIDAATSAGAVTEALELAEATWAAVLAGDA